MPVSTYQDRITLVNSTQVGTRQRTNNPDGFHPMIRTRWGTIDRFRGLLGAYYLEYPGTQGNALWSAGAQVTPTNPNALDPSQGAMGGSVAAQFVGPNHGTNIILDYDIVGDLAPYPTGENTINLQFSDAAWSSYAGISETARNYFRYVGIPNNGDLSVFAPAQAIASRLKNVLDNRPAPERPLTHADQTPGIFHGLIATPLHDHTTKFFLDSADPLIRERAGSRFSIHSVYERYEGGFPAYEDIIAPDNVPEHLIPNGYYLQLELQNESESPLAGGRYVTALSLNHQEIADAADGSDRRWFQQTVSWANGFGYTEQHVTGFYRLYSEALAAPTINLASLSTLIEKDIFVLHRDREILEENNVSPDAPFYNVITIPTPGYFVDGEILRTLAGHTGEPVENGLDLIDMLQVKAIENLRATESQTMSFKAQIKHVTAATDDAPFTNTAPTIEYPLVYDLDRATDEIDAESSEIAVQIEQDHVIAGVGGLHDRPPVGTEEDPSIDVNDQIGSAVETLEILSDQSTRSFQQMLNGNSCHVETLMFVVKKYRDSDGPNAAPRQTFYLTNFMDLESRNITYYDSQVKMGIKYRYTVERVALIFGNEYRYAFPNGTLEVEATPIQTQLELSEVYTRYDTTVKAFNTSNVKAVLVPYINGTLATVIHDKPPVQPDISFYSFQGINNRVKILLQPSTGRESQKPVAILEQDKSYFVEQYLAETGIQTSFDNIERLSFLSDDPVESYQLFRINTEPTTYADFESGLVRTIAGNVSPSEDLKDEIIPNTVYYYCARAIDVHGNVSNPTPIFKVEMVDNGGQIFLRQELFMFEAPTNQYTKSGRRFIYIEPSFQQLAVDEEDPTALGTPNILSAPISSILGAPEIDKVWEKTFKIRTTSKKTGRKLDLNITFKNTGIVNPSE